MNISDIFSVSDFKDAENGSSTDNEWIYMNPLEMANVICDEIIPKVRGGKYRSWKKKKSLIRSFLVQNDYDSFKVSLYPRGLEKNIENLCPVEEEEDSDSSSSISDESYSFLADRDSKFVKSLKEEFPASAQKWMWIARAVGHEMSPKLGGLVEAVSPELSDLNHYSGKELHDVINTKTSRNLTVAEFKYLQSLIQRACSSKNTFQISSLETGNIERDAIDFDQNWPGLNAALVRDIFNTHKVFEFGAFKCSEYKLNDFQEAVKEAEKTIFKKHICSKMLSVNWRGKSNFDAKCTLFPKWMIRDDIFQVFHYIFAVSDGVNRLLKCKDDMMPFEVFCCVIPKQMLSLYDHDIKYEHSIGDIDEWLSETSCRIFHRQTAMKSVPNPFDIAGRIEQYRKKVQESNILIILVDRRAVDANREETITFLECSAVQDVRELITNHFIGLHFKVDVKRVVRCWLQYGSEQRLRFWPEQLIWFLPRLFMKGDDSRSPYQFAKRLYSDDYKHGFCVNLSDPVFDRYYKMLTSWTHQSVNYRRYKGVKSGSQGFGFRDYAEQKLNGIHMVKVAAFWTKNGYSTDDILDDISVSELGGDSNIMAAFDDDVYGWTQLVDVVHKYKKTADAICCAENVLEIWHCQYVDDMIRALTEFQNHKMQIDAGNVVEYDHSAIIRGVDHLAEVHDLFSAQNKKRIRAYFREKIQCQLGGDCEALIHHCSRRRENDGIQSDDDLDEVDSLISVTRGSVCSAHCYLLHSDETLYRLSGQSSKFEMNPFSTPVVEPENEEKKGDDEPAVEAPPSIDFGVHILQWLAFGQLPRFDSFQEEMIRNPASTLSQELLEQYKMCCAAKLDGKNWTEEHFDELLCLKLYSDCTKLQNLFRKAYWTSAPLETKRAFYQWGLMMYKTFLFHAQPIPKMVGKNGMKMLYHGLNKLFMINDTEPTYQGPFSTTTSSNVANTFADGKGLIWNLKGSYVNPLEFVIGINMARISCFKHEAEILLYSQSLPIKKTKTFTENAEEMVNHLMHCVKSTKEQILDKNVFFKNIGVGTFKLNWSVLLTVHPLLTERTLYNDMTVANRLLNELEMKWLSLCKDVRFDELFTFNGSRLLVTAERIPDVEGQQLCNWIFTVSVDGEHLREKYDFDHITRFSIPVISPIFDVGSSTSDITMWVKNKNGSSDQVALGVFEYEHPFAQYNLQNDESLVIENVVTVDTFDESIGRGGSIQIHSAAPINIDVDGGIDADSAGPADTDQIQRVLRSESLSQNSKDVTRLHFGTVNMEQDEGGDSARGGGIIVLESTETVTINGKLTSNGSAGGGSGGGSICIIAAGCAIGNGGNIESKPNGRIIVQCSLFVNEGVIAPAPDIFISDDAPQRVFEIVSLPWNRSGGKLEEIPLSVHRYRGCAYDYDGNHPRNLLDKKGTDTDYWGKSPAVGDWIIFKIDAHSIVIPKGVIIQNRQSSDGIKSIELSLAVDGDDDDEFKEFAVIQDIQIKDGNKEQYFNLKDVLLNNEEMWMNNYNFIKLKVLSNWGADNNDFYSFSVFGVICE